jgi:hypothetical protein
MSFVVFVVFVVNPNAPFVVFVTFVVNPKPLLRDLRDLRGESLFVFFAVHREDIRRIMGRGR